MTWAIAGSEIQAKTVNTKTDNASTFFMIVLLLRQATLHMSNVFRETRRSTHQRQVDAATVSNFGGPHVMLLFDVAISTLIWKADDG